MRRRVRMGRLVCVREGNSEEESRTTVTYFGVVLHVHLRLERRMVMGMGVEAKVSDSEAR